MARSLLVSPQTSQLLLTSSISKASHFSRFLNCPSSSFSTRSVCSCSCSHRQENNNNGPIDISMYSETFAKRMEMAGLKPHHPIVLGVSGGPDSMALCALTAAWKTSSLAIAAQKNGFVDGLLAVIVDHGFRAESKDEANLVHRRVTSMGIKCEIACCEWSEGKPKLGHLQEAARQKRYEILQGVCIQHQIGVLMTAHHADDQAELFILRLSRNSGVLGLAGMAFVSQLFSTGPNLSAEALRGNGVLLVRPLLEFSKEDMYKICLGANQEWVEDPTNRSTLFARNRIRMTLTNLASSIFRSELHALIAACRRTRLYVDKICSNLMHQAVAIMPEGYAVIDLGILNPSELKDIVLSKFIALLLQFVSQRQRPVRGSASRLLLDYIRASPCKTAVTASGCYLCPAPGSKGTKVLVCCSSDADFTMELLNPYLTDGQNCSVAYEIEHILANGKSCSDQFPQSTLEVQYLDPFFASSIQCPDHDGPASPDSHCRKPTMGGFSSYYQRGLHSQVANPIPLVKGERTFTIPPHPSVVQFLDLTSSDSILAEAKREGIVGESTYRSIISLQLEESNNFKLNTNIMLENKVENKMEHTASVPSEVLHPERIGYFMNRFLVKWNLGKKIANNLFSMNNSKQPQDSGERWNFCNSCVVGRDPVAKLRYMVDADWLYLAMLSKRKDSDNVLEEELSLSMESRVMCNINLCSAYTRKSAESALLLLKSIPVAARRALPVLVSVDGVLLSIPSVGFQHCPCLEASATFKPKIPLGGGYNSFM